MLGPPLRVRFEISAALAAAALAVAAPTARADDPPPAARLYGTVQVDAVWSDSRFDDLAAPTVVEPEPGGDSQRELAIHPRLTRIGLEINPETLDTSAEVGGLVEVDFAGDGRLGALRIRHAYVEATRGPLELLAGQTWDLVSPLVPTVNGVTMMWDAGNTGGFRPQVRVGARTRGRRLRLHAALAAGMPGAVGGADRDGDGVGDGAASGIPAAQALVEVEHDRFQVGVWGHAGRERLGTAIAGRRNLSVLMAGAHLRAELLLDRLWLQGEIYAGENLGDLRGGSAAGLDGRGDEVRAAGGWGELETRSGDRWSLAVGGGINDPRNRDLPAPVTRNWALWAAPRYQVWGTGTVGVDYIYWATDYRGGNDGRASRVDLLLALDW